MDCNGVKRNHCCKRHELHTSDSSLYCDNQAQSKARSVGEPLPSCITTPSSPPNLVATASSKDVDVGEHNLIIA